MFTGELKDASGPVNDEGQKLDRRNVINQPTGAYMFPSFKEATVRSNRRQDSRIPCAVSAREIGPFTGEARVTNLSRGGLYLQRMNDEPLEYGALVHLNLELPSGRARVVGRVVRPADEVFFEAASVRFEIVRPRDQAVIDAFVAAREQQPTAVIGRLALVPHPTRPSLRGAKTRAKRLQHSGAWLPNLERRGAPITL